MARRTELFAGFFVGLALLTLLGWIGAQAAAAQTQPGSPLQPDPGFPASAAPAEPGVTADDLPAAPGFMPYGLRPFLARRPFTETYKFPIPLNSFFDHMLPLYDGEYGQKIPADLRDTAGLTRLFTGEDRFPSLGLGYDAYSGHDGLDYSLAGLVVAPADGTIEAGREITSCQVVIGHDASSPPNTKADYVTTYMHLKSIGTAPEKQRSPTRQAACGSQWCAGDTIKKGQIIGEAGDKPCGGKSDGVHLHFEVGAGSLARGPAPRVRDPFGWWSNAADPWANALLAPPGNRWPQVSSWLWAAPQDPGPGQPGHWDAGIAAQTDDLDASFHRFGPKYGARPWVPVLPDGTSAVTPIRGGAWRSTSIVTETATVKKNWAVWGLHVPATGDYNIQVHVPALPSGATATERAVYTVRVPTADRTLDIWQSLPVFQRVDVSGWLDIVRPGATDVFRLQGGSVVLLELSDVTGTADQAVVFDAARLTAVSPPEPPPSEALHRVGFAIDNSSSMQAEGKMSALKATVPPWLDQLETLSAPFEYGYAGFADNVVGPTSAPDVEQVKSWIQGLAADDNGQWNSDCPEESLAAIKYLAPFVEGGDILFFTDDLAHSPVWQGAEALAALIQAQARLHAIILPKTCSGGDPTGWATYKLLSSVSGGTYQAVTTDRTDEALAIVLARMQATSGLGTYDGRITAARSAGTAAPAGTQAYDIVVDDSIAQLGVLLNVVDGSLALTLYRPDGLAVNPGDPDVTYLDSGAAQYYAIAAPRAGTWQASVTGMGGYVVHATASGPVRLDYVGEVLGSPLLPIKLAARLGGPLASVAFRLERLDGTVAQEVALRDDGTGGDVTASDGLYAGWFTPSASDDFRLRVTGTTATGTPFSRSDPRQIRIRNLNVLAPPGQILAPGASGVFQFEIYNFEPTTQVYELNATSTYGWLVAPPPTTVTTPGQSATTVSLAVAVPPDATPNLVDLLRLTAVNQADRTILAEAIASSIVPDYDSAPWPQVRVYVPLVVK